MKIGFLGTGAISSAMITGLCSTGAEHSIHVSPRNAETARDLARRFPQVTVASSNQEVVDASEIVVVAVRPPAAVEVLTALRFRPDHHVITLVNALSQQRAAALVAPAEHVVRAVPLPSTAQRRCPTAIFPADGPTEELFNLLGAAFAVETERQFEAFCTATATMATYFSLMDTIASWLSRNGIPPSQSRDYIARIFSGLADTAIEAPDRSFQTLASDHATPGGINEHIVKTLTGRGVFDTLSEILDAVMRRVTAASQ